MLVGRGYMQRPVPGQICRVDVPPEVNGRNHGLEHLMVRGGVPTNVNR